MKPGLEAEPRLPPAGRTWCSSHGVWAQFRSGLGFRVYGLRVFLDLGFRVYVFFGGFFLDFEVPDKRFEYLMSYFGDRK